MERRVNKKIDEFIVDFKTKIATQLQELVLDLDNEMHESALQEMNHNKKESLSLDSYHNMKNKVSDLLNFVYNFEKLKLQKDDFMKRKRVKSIVPIYDRCCAKRANGEQCTRRKKEGETYCGTHIKGTPHSVMEESSEMPTTKNVKVDIWAQDIKGIIYYIDKNMNVYDTEDIMNIDKQPKRVIAKYELDSNGLYNIPSMFSQLAITTTSD